VQHLQQQRQQCAPGARASLSAVRLQALLLLSRRQYLKSRGHQQQQQQVADAPGRQPPRLPLPLPLLLLLLLLLGWRRTNMVCRTDSWKMSQRSKQQVHSGVQGGEVVRVSGVGGQQEQQQSSKQKSRQQQPSSPLGQVLATGVAVASST
jgi:hypothetical protein